MKRYRPILCPVCGKTYFAQPLEEFKESELEAYKNGEEYCWHCGWIYDLDQAENRDLKDGYNDKSVNEYKKWYKEKLANDPEYSYFEELEDF